MKEMGLFPYYLSKMYGLDARVLCYENGPYPFLEKELKGLKIEFLDKKNKKTIFKTQTSILKYLFRFSKEIDIFCVKTMTRENLIYLFLYKILNPSGKSYLKLDSDMGIVNNSLLKYRFNRFIFRKIFDSINLFSIETRKIHESLLEKFPCIFKNKLEYIPNTIYVNNETIEKLIEKEKIILTLGSIGLAQKASEILLEAFLKINRPDWTLVFAGPIFNQFDLYVEEKRKQYPQLAGNIFLTGKLDDRAKINELYDKATVFCLPSRWESFGIVWIEAASRKCYLVASDLPSAQDITDNWRYGYKVQPGNLESLVQALSFVTNDGNYKNIQEKGQLLSEYFKETYSPEIVMGRLYEWILRS